MEPQREDRATMTDLIERVMDKGVVVKLDLVVGVAGIPLIGISLHAAIAAIETMLEYGMMDAWDSQTRAFGHREAPWPQLALRPGEQVQVELYGSYHRTEGIWRAWRPGRLLVTDQRLLLIRPLPGEVLFAAEVSAIAGVGRVQRENVAGAGRDVTCLALDDGTLVALYSAEADVLEACLRERFQQLGRTVTELSAADVGLLEFGAVAAGQLWHCWSAGAGQAHWKSGWAVLTADELTWRADVGQGIRLRVPLTQVENLAVERREFRDLGARDVLVVSHTAEGRQAEALFTGEKVSDWPAAVRRVARTRGEDGDGDA
jgi:Gas vesicle protein